MGVNKAPESSQLTLEWVKIKDPSKKNLFQKKTIKLKPEERKQNYYRAVEIFGDIATKKNEYLDQPFRNSTLKAFTQKSKGVDDVVIKVNSTLGDTAKDAQAYDIIAKVVGVGGFTQMYNCGKPNDKDATKVGTDAYNFFLEVNSDDFTLRETEYKGQKEIKAYFDPKKSDGKITVFSSEIINQKEYLAMRNKNGKIHYFDIADGLKDVTMNIEI